MPLSTPQLPILYSFRRCPFAMRARLGLLAAGQPCELREVLLRDKPESLRMASAKATVPVLVNVDGRVVDESLDIMLWALRRNDPKLWLVPTDGDQAQMMALISECDHHFKPLLDRYKYPQRFELATGSSPRDQASQWLCKLDSRLALASNSDGRDIRALQHSEPSGKLSAQAFGPTRDQPSGQLFGQRICLADAAIFPFVRQFAHVDGTWFADQPWSALQNWLQGWLKSEIFTQAMHKYPFWVEGTAGEPFPVGQY